LVAERQGVERRFEDLVLVHAWGEIIVERDAALDLDRQRVPDYQ
jgi:hypothetical protein